VKDRMKQPHRFIVAASIALAYAATAIPAVAAVSASPAVLDASNPFARVSTLPFHYPAFDKIKDEHFKPAFEVGMREHLLESRRSPTAGTRRLRQHRRRDGARGPAAGARVDHLLEPAGREHQRQPGCDRPRDVAEAGCPCRTRST
jgi:hypothetical protein